MKKPIIETLHLDFYNQGISVNGRLVNENDVENMIYALIKDLEQMKALLTVLEGEYGMSFEGLKSAIKNNKQVLKEVGCES